MSPGRRPTDDPGSSQMPGRAPPVSARNGRGLFVWASRRCAQTLRPAIHTVPHGVTRRMRVLPYEDPGLPTRVVVPKRS
jgi:hypothetical protein